MFKLIIIGALIFAGYRLVKYDSILGPKPQKDLINEETVDDSFSDYEEIE